MEVSTGSVTPPLPLPLPLPLPAPSELLFPLPVLLDEGPVDTVMVIVSPFLPVPV